MGSGHHPGYAARNAKVVISTDNHCHFSGSDSPGPYLTPKGAEVKLVRIIAPLAVTALVLTACSSKNSDKPAEKPAGETSSSISVLATTNVYASIATAIGGANVKVQAIPTDPAADPHSFEAPPKVAEQISKSQVFIANSGGYDDFAQKLMNAAQTKPEFIDVVELSGLQHEESAASTPAASSPAATSEGHDHGAFNEHVFYHLPTMIKLADKMAATFCKLDPAKAAEFTKNAKIFTEKIATLQARTADVKKRHPNLKAVLTEPVAGYLLTEEGVQDITPKEFSEAVENETDPSVKDMADTTALLTSKQANLLVVNIQTGGPLIDKLTESAKTAGVPILDVTETLPKASPITSPGSRTPWLTWIRPLADASRASRS